MKYFAVLKDSVREAVDSKVLYVMCGLSLLATLFIASLTFTPQPADEFMKRIVEGELTDFVSMLGPLGGEEGHQRRKRKGPKSNLHLHSLTTVRGEPNSPESEYALVVRMTSTSPEQAAEVRKNPDSMLSRIRQQFAFVEMLELLKVADARVLPDFARGKDATDKDVFFEVKTQPTPATPRVWLHEPALFFGALPLHQLKMPLGALLFFFTATVIGMGSWIAVLLSVIITASFIPNMLRKGTVDLLLVKPVYRWTLLLYKYLGGLFFIFVNTAFALGGIWLALGLRSGVWSTGILLMILVITAFFAILYAVSTLFGVLTRSPVVAILMTCGAWFFFFVVGLLQQVLVKEEVDNAFADIVRAVYTVTPRTSDMNTLGTQLVLNEFLTGTILRDVPMPDEGHVITWRESLTINGVFVALTLGLSCWWFSTKDY